jgi:hypothetical protein
MLVLVFREEESSTVAFISLIGTLIASQALSCPLHFCHKHEPQSLSVDRCGYDEWFILLF